MTAVPPPLGTLVVPVDVRTSTVLTPSPDQIGLGTVPLRTRNDLVYSKNLRLDLLRPDTEDVLPVVIYVTGGGFVMADRRNAEDRRRYIAEAGFAVASIQYRTVADAATYHDGIADVLAAVQWIRAHAAEHGIDPGRIALWGESAGGYLVAMAAILGIEGLQVVIDMFGASDLAHIADDFDEHTRALMTGPGNPFAQYILGAPGPLTDLPPEANPLTKVDGTEPPFVFFHGDADPVVSPSQTLLLHNALLDAGSPSTRYVVAGADHGALPFIDDPAAGRLWTSVDVLDCLVGSLRAHLGR